MKAININKVSSVVLWAIILITLVVLGLFYFGGETPVEERLVADTSMSEPKFTDAIMYWMYFLLAFAAVATVVSAIASFASEFKTSPKSALQGMMGLGGLVLVLIISWILGSGEPMDILGYDGTDNSDYFWLKTSDMFIIGVYILMGLMILLMLGFGIINKIKNK